MSSHTSARFAVHLRKAGRFAMFLMRRGLGDNVMGVAASLSYTSLLALVPLLAIAVAILAAFPVFDTVRDQISDFALETLVPSSRDVIQENVGRFVAATDQLTAVGVAGLAVTAVMTLATIERAFNIIFRVARGRDLVARVVVYWTILTLGPLLIGASFAVAGMLYDETSRLIGGSLSLVEKVAFLTPYLLTLLAFMLVYILVPNRPVRFLDALAGAVVAASLFAGLRLIFVAFLGSAGTYQTLYGALAALPLFLIWMFLSWLMVLIGAVLTAALPEWRQQRGHLAGAGAAGRMALGIDLIGFLAAGREDGRGRQRGEILTYTGAAEAAVMATLDRLRAARFVERTTGGGWVLTRGLQATTLGQLLDALDMGLPPISDDAPIRPWTSNLRAVLEDARGAGQAALDVPLAELFPSPAGCPIVTEG